eukprot:SM000076S21769  [mRNA]  locus=s76:172377:176127:- [translate_table: standard]
MATAAAATLYSSSPPASYARAHVAPPAPPSHTSSLPAELEFPLGPSRAASRSRSSTPVRGGLSSFFGSGAIKNVPPCAGPADHVKSAPSSALYGSSPIADGAVSTSRDCGERRVSRAVSIPVATSFPSKDRSPASVLHGVDSSSTASGSRQPSPLLGGAPIWQMTRHASLPQQQENLYTKPAGFTYSAGVAIRPARSGDSPPQVHITDVSAARDRLLRLLEQDDPQSILVESPPFSPAKDPAERDQLRLMDAQRRHAIFNDPLVIKAFNVAASAHQGQVRRSGDPYLSHCVETAMILAQSGCDKSVVAAGLLHDTLDDSPMTEVQLQEIFDTEITNLVAGISKLSMFSQLTRDSETVFDPEEADRLRNMFLAMVDVRVVLIKLADRLHNLRTLDALPLAKQIRVATESLETFAPLANRLGIWSWKAEIEDICFEHLHAKEHKQLSSVAAAINSEATVMQSIRNFHEALEGADVQIDDLCGRPKNLYSIYKKMKSKQRKIEEIYDVRGVRLIVPDEESCYAALDVVRGLWQTIPSRSKDYIKNPKPNGYMSLHEVVLAEDGKPLEVQIRTRDMHHQAEFGMAAHWRYKEGHSEQSVYVLRKVEWARWILTWHNEMLDMKYRLSPAVTDLRPPCPFPTHSSGCRFSSLASPESNSASNSEPLFVIVMSGDNMAVKELPLGATPAELLNEMIHQEHLDLSNSIVRPLVNHEFVDMEQTLRMGDVVELTVEELDVAEPDFFLSCLPKHVDDSVEGARGLLIDTAAVDIERERLVRWYSGDLDCALPTTVDC